MLQNLCKAEKAENYKHDEQYLNVNCIINVDTVPRSAMHAHIWLCMWPPNSHAANEFAAQKVDIERASQCGLATNVNASNNDSVNY